MYTKTTILLVAVAIAQGAPGYADEALGVPDMPKIHSEYEANQGRWAKEYEGKIFDASLHVEKLTKSFFSDDLSATFEEDVVCLAMPSSDFLVAIRYPSGARLLAPGRNMAE